MMKLTLNKKALKNLSLDSRVLPDQATPHIGGGITAAAGCQGSVNETVCACNSDQVCETGSCETCVLNCGNGGSGGSVACATTAGCL